MMITLHSKNNNGNKRMREIKENSKKKEKESRI